MSRGLKCWIRHAISGLFLASICVVVACSSTSDPIETRDGASDGGVAGEGGNVQAGDGGDGGCSDDDGFIPSCSDINGLAERQCDRATCDRYVKRMKTRMARLAIQCMKKHITAGDSCRPCSLEALKTACIDPNAQGACDSFAKTCPTRTAAECVPLISGLSFGGRLNFVTCATDDNCLHDLPSCLP